MDYISNYLKYKASLPTPTKKMNIKINEMDAYSNFVMNPIELPTTTTTKKRGICLKKRGCSISSLIHFGQILWKNKAKIIKDLNELQDT